MAKKKYCQNNIIPVSINASLSVGIRLQVSRPVPASKHSRKCNWVNFYYKLSPWWCCLIAEEFNWILQCSWRAKHDDNFRLHAVREANYFYLEETLSTECLRAGSKRRSLPNELAAHFYPSSAYCSRWLPARSNAIPNWCSNTCTTGMKYQSRNFAAWQPCASPRRHFSLQLHCACFCIKLMHNEPLEDF